MNNLFNEQLFKKYLDDIEITQDQIDHLTLWNQKLDNGELIAETSNYHYFEKVFLNKLLDYDSFTDILADDKEISGSGKSEFKLKRNDEVFMIIELKGSNINLDKTRNNKNETPVDQVFRYAKKNEAVPWLLVSNYDEFRLYNYHKGDGRYISWTIKDLIEKKDKLREFMFVLGKKSFENHTIDNLIDKTITIQEDFNDEFYKLYAETRLMLIHDLEETSKNIDRLKAIHYAQLIMDRVIFICFAEDKGLLPEQILEDTILTPIQNNNVRKHRIFERLRELFEDVNEGNPGKNVSEYNGGLFKESIGFLNLQDTIENPTEYYKNCFSQWKFESQKNQTEELLGEYKDTLNPIYKNILTMAIFNFDSDVDVNILGHIFESSISDIEKLKEDNSETRHKFGIHYTPPEITEYICKNTIIPYLSKTGTANDIPELLSEYKKDTEILDEKLKNIKILDPACGSGAFLNKAVDILLEIHAAVWHQRYDNKTTLDKYFDNEEVRREIILNNIYGVDLNEESTEITKLGLFLKICKKDKKLPSLDENIKCGNSVIDDPEYAGEKAFKWEEEFKEIIEYGGFDVIIGNPPYVRVQEIEYNELDYYSNNYKFAMGHIDISILFIELAIKLIKENGKIGFITSNMFLTTDYGENIRDYLSKADNIKIDKILDFGDLPVFDEALTYVDIFLFTKCKGTDFKYHFVKSLDENLFNIRFNSMKLDDFNEKEWVLKNYFLKKIFNKIEKNTSFKSNKIICNYGTITGLDELLAFKKLDEVPFEKEIMIPFIRAEQCERYEPVYPQEYIAYPYSIKDNKRILFSLEELNSNYPLYYNYIMEHKSELEKRKDSRKTLENTEDWYKLIRPGNPITFSQEKIVYQGLCKKNKFTLDYSGSACVGGGVFYIISENQEINLKSLLGILNSKLIEVYLHSTTPLKKGGYHKYSTNTINKLPLSINNNLKDIEKGVVMVLSAEKELTDEINQFIKWLKYNYKIEKTSKKLNKYYLLSFEEFLDEIKKKKIKINKKNYNEFEEEFNQSLNIINPLLNKIEIINQKIDEKVYQLYDLTDEEIRTIEENM